MSHMRVSQSLNLRFGIFTVLLFHTVLLGLIHPCRGQHRVISSSKLIVAPIGEDVILPSVLDPRKDAFRMTVEWTRPDLDPRFVLVWRDGVELENKKHPSYVGRASVFIDELKDGNISLKLSKVNISDGGTYRCFIPEFNIDSTVQLVVGQPRVVGPAQPIVALVGEDVILSSRLDRPVNTFGMTVEWTRPDLDPRFVLVWRDGVELENKKHTSYRGRASVVTDELKRGNVSLKLSEVKISDGGTYRCFIPDFNIVSTVQLVVGAASSPVVQKTRNSSVVVLQCESEGWYPEPEVSWLDSEGHVLPAGPTETVRGPDGLYTVSSRVTLEKKHRNNFTCRVQQKNINQTRETQIHVPVEFFVDSSGSSSTSSSPAPAIIGLVVGIMLILAAFAVWKWRQNRIKNKKHPEDEETLREKRGGNKSELESLIPTDRQELTAESETVNNLDKLEEDTGLQTQIHEETHQRESSNTQPDLQPPTEGGTRTGLDQVQEQTGTEPISDTRDASNPASNDAQCSVNEGTDLQFLMEGGRQTDLQPLAEGGTESGLDKGHVETETKSINERRDAPKSAESDLNKLKTQTQEAHQRESNDVQCSERTELQLSVEGGRQTDLQPLAEGATKTGLDKGQVETETKSVNERRDAPNPAESDLNNKEDETKSVSENTEQPMEERQTGNNLQTDEDKEETLNDKEKDTLMKKLKTKERELGKFEEQVSRYESQMKIKEEQIKELNQQLEEVERQREETERKIQSVDRQEDKDEADKLLLDTKNDLERKKEVLKKELEKREKDLERIKKDLIAITNKKIKATNEKEEIIKRLNRSEDQSDPVDSLSDGLAGIKLS